MTLNWPSDKQLPHHFLVPGCLELAGLSSKQLQNQPGRPLESLSLKKPLLLQEAKLVQSRLVQGVCNQFLGKNTWLGNLQWPLDDPTLSVAIGSHLNPEEHFPGSLIKVCDWAIKTPWSWTAMTVEMGTEYICALSPLFSLYKNPKSLFDLFSLSGLPSFILALTMQY